MGLLGLGNTPYPALTEADLALLDQAAALTLAPNQAFDATRALYESEASLHVPPLITSYTMDDQKTMVEIGSTA